MTDHPMSPEEFLRQVGEIVKMPIDKPDTIVSALRDVRADFDTFAEWAQPYLDSGLWGGHSILDAIKQETIKRDEEVRRLRSALERLASYEAFTGVWNNNSPEAAGYRSELRARANFAENALAVGEEVRHG